MKYFSLILSFAICLNVPPSGLWAQGLPKKPNSSDIYDALKKLQTLGSVLYVAAHPDDENTRMISYFANARHMDVTYLSVTRGDGGQNLIGTELREMLGVLRTQELLMARSIDGGKQMFTRANDFGFSKSPAETFRMWNKKEVLSDVVWVMRKVQPDVVINRFSIDTSFDTHGHHTGSAILSNEAFDIASDPSVYPEQLTYVKPWQPKRLFINQTWWFYGNQDTFKKIAEREKFVSFDAGVYLPTRGKSNDEIAAESRSMHRCQAMGMLSSRGANPEYLQVLKLAKGEMKPTKDPFEGINTSWSRLDGGDPIGKLIASIIKNFEFDNPAASINELLKARKMILALPNSYWKDKKLGDIEKVIQWCAGLYVEATSKDYSLTQNNKADINIEVINRSATPMVLTNVKVLQKSSSKNAWLTTVDSTMTADLKYNASKMLKYNIPIDLDAATTNPYWLEKSGTIGAYYVGEQLLRGLPETPRSLEAEVTLLIYDQKLTYRMPVVYRTGNPAKGEVYRPVEVTPSVFVNLVEKVYVFHENEPKDISFIVKAGGDNVAGILKPKVAKGWKLEPEALDFALKIKGEEKVLTFKLLPPPNESEAVITAQVLMLPKMAIRDNNVEYQPVMTKSVKLIEYDHIPTQTVLQPADAKVVKLNIEKRGDNIGYFMGAGDDMPTCLEQIGYKVTILNDQDFQSRSLGSNGLRRFDAIVMGIRAYNTKEKLKFYNEQLMDYVKNGGTLIVQYNTNGRDLLVPQFGPYPLKLGRGRTSEEDAEIRILKPNHSVFNVPNKISSKDFGGWVQERGLYFLSEWDNQYEAVLSCNDVGEKKEDGGLVIAKVEKGHFVYTGLSFFRQLPAGVPGAYRLFANLLSLGKNLP